MVASLYNLTIPDEDNLILVSFERNKTGSVETKSENVENDSARMIALEQELQASREHLQTVIEELETSNEELQLLNEELQSSNEELQSTNEELETSNEELQSTNEELTTVNDELNLKKQEVEQNHDELINIKNSIDFPLIRVNEELCIERSNESARRLFEIPNHRSISIVKYLPNELNPTTITKKCSDVIKGQSVDDDNVSYNKRHYWIKYAPYTNSKKEITGVILTFIDDTDKILGQEKLRDSQERYKALANTANIPIFIKDLGGKYLSANKALQDLLGLSEEEILGRRDKDIQGNPRNAKQPFRKNDLEVQKKKHSMSFEENLEIDGKMHTFLSIKSPLFDKDGKVYATSGIAIDITERKEYLEQLKLYKSVIENANDIVLITEAEPINEPGPDIVYVNKAFEKLTNYTSEEVVGKSPRFLQGKETDRKTLDNYRKALEAKKPFTCQLLNYSKDGKKYYQDINTVPVKDENGVVKYFASIQRDITERINYEKKLEYRSNEIKKAHNVKSDFLSNMSHEIRTPMNAVCGITDILENFDVSPKKQKDLIHKLNSSSKQLKDLMDDILDFSKLEANQLKIEHKKFDLKDVLSEVYDINSIKADEKEIDLIFPKNLRIPSKLVGDKTRLKQILLNLISNAIKFTDDGYVRLRIKKLSDLYNTKILVEFEVEDTGTGITEANQKEIFDKFSQGNIAFNKKVGGTGLGLTISKKLVEAMGGQISLTSEKNAGTSFKVQIPLDVYQGKAKKIPKTIEDKSIKLSHPILIVEDNLINIDVISFYLKEAGLKFHVATNGHDALKKVKAKNYSLILLDLQMDGMDGFEVCEQIRGMNSSKSDIPIVAITAHAEKSIKNKCIKYKMQDFLSKPIDIEKLFEVIDKFK